MNHFPSNAKPGLTSGQALESQLKLENAIQQFIVLKDAQQATPGELASQNATRLLEQLCQPIKNPENQLSRASSDQGELTRHLSLLRKELP